MSSSITRSSRLGPAGSSPSASRTLERLATAGFTDLMRSPACRARQVSARFYAQHAGRGPARNRSATSTAGIGVRVGAQPMRRTVAGHERQQRLVHASAGRCGIPDRSQVIGRNGDGQDTATSNPTNIATAARPVNTTEPSITGTARVGNTAPIVVRVRITARGGRPVSGANVFMRATPRVVSHGSDGSDGRRWDRDTHARAQPAVPATAQRLQRAVLHQGVQAGRPRSGRSCRLPARAGDWRAEQEPGVNAEWRRSRRHSAHHFLGQGRVEELASLAGS
jgi:hypothetical protein